ncbi:MAG: hypothetical protein AAF183_01195 [Pseudomonadota bacterium]
MLSVLRWIGGQARWVLAIGVLLATVLPDLSAILRPFMPVFVALVFCVAMIRVDLVEMLRSMARPRHLVRLCALTIALLWLTPAVLWLLGETFGLAPEMSAALVYTGAAPPITLAAALCLMLGLNAAWALELTIFSSLAAPFLGPVAVTLLLGEALPIEPWPLALRMGGMILAGALAAVVARWIAGAERLRTHAVALDGVGALAVLIFVIPLFDGFWSAVFANPTLAAALLGLAVTVNFGMQAILARTLMSSVGRPLSGAAGLTWGNRTVALYLAALPPDPVFALYVALYQVPMLFTPLVMARVLGALRRDN